MKWDTTVTWHLVYFSLYENLNILVLFFSSPNLYICIIQRKIPWKQNIPQKKKKHLEFGHYHEYVEVKYYKREELFSFFLFQFCNLTQVVNHDRYKTTTQPNFAHIYIYMKVMTFYIVGYLLELDIESNNSPIKTFPFGD